MLCVEAETGSWLMLLRKAYVSERAYLQNQGAMPKEWHPLLSSGLYLHTYTHMTACTHTYTRIYALPGVGGPQVGAT